MKTWTIRRRLACWYAAVTVLMLCAFFLIGSVTLTPAILINGRRLIEKDAKEIAGELERSRFTGRLDFDDDLDIRSNTYYSVYDTDGKLVLDNHEFSWLDKLQNSAGELLHITQDQEDWLIYDRFAYDEGDYIGRLRVAMTVTSAGDATRMLLELMMYVLPLGILFSIGIGLFIAGRALRPVDEITKSALAIRRGDLSLRLNLPKTEDEIGRMAATLDEMLASLDAAYEREKRFTSDAAHELRTPLSVIIASAEEMLNTKNVTPEQYRASLRDIYQKGRDMQAMLSQMLLLARMFENKQAMERIEINFGEVVADIADESRSTAAKKEITIETDIEPDAYVYGDLLLLTRVAMNLIDNAILYGKQGGFIRLSVKKETGKTVFTVADNGVGLSPGDLPHIFERFYRVDSSRSSGSGLGLTMVQQIVRLHNGDITVESTIGVGTTFRVAL